MEMFKVAIRGKRYVKVMRSGGHKIPLLLTTQNHYFVNKSSERTMPSGFGIVTGSVKLVWGGEVDPSLTNGTDEAWFYVIA